MSTMRIISGLLPLFIILLCGTSTFAQTEQNISDKEIKQFTSAFQEIQAIDQQAQQEMAKKVENSGLNVQRFNEIQQAEQFPDQEVEATDEEMEKYQSANKELEKIQTNAQQQMTEKIESEGLSINKYQEIANRLQSDPELKKRIQEEMQG